MDEEKGPIHILYSACFDKYENQYDNFFARNYQEIEIVKEQTFCFTLFL